MFDTFSKQFESAFRGVFITWVSFWGVVNLSTLLFQYAGFYSGSSASPSDSQLGEWWLNSMGTIVSITAGVFLFFMMINAGGKVLKSKQIRGIATMTVLAVFYYLFITLIQIISKAFFTPNTFARDFVFLSVWLMPSIILLVVHMLYFTNLRRYNEELTNPVVA